MKTKVEVINALQKIAKYFKSHKIDCSSEILKLKETLESIEEQKFVFSNTYELPHDIDKKEGDFFVYSDGACRGNPGIGAYGFMVQNDLGEVLFEDAAFYSHTTNNQMELLGAIEGIKWASTKGAHRIFVYSDSRYLVDGINKWVSGWKKRGWKKSDKKEPENLSLWKQVDELNETFQCEFHWVKGHSGHPQNERCDELANICIDENL